MYDMFRAISHTFSIAYRIKKSMGINENLSLLVINTREMTSRAPGSWRLKSARYMSFTVAVSQYFRVCNLLFIPIGARKSLGNDGFTAILR